VNIERSNISLIRFLEEWKYDEKTLQIDKEVYGIAPVTEVYVDGISMTRLLFWIYTDEDFLGK
jgi:hypothetical protein